MGLHKCCCLFIPPRVLENMARTGIEQARLSIQQSQQSRAKRSAKIVDMATFTAAPKAGAAKRQVYDCKSTWLQRVKLVRSEGAPASADGAVNDAYNYGGKVRDYFKKVLGRNSIDNLDMDLILNVHFGLKYMNAFWDGDEMTFGDGDGEIFINFSKSLDVVAHELAHGVTQFTARAHRV